MYERCGDAYLCAAASVVMACILDWMEDLEAVDDLPDFTLHLACCSADVLGSV
jgi:hypothetical protein